MEEISFLGIEPSIQNYELELNIFKANKDNWNKQLLQTSQYNYCLLDYVLEQEDEGKFNNEFQSTYGNLEYVNGLSSDARRSLSHDIVAHYKLPLFDLEARLKVFKHVELDAVKENVGNMKSAIDQLSTLGDEERTRIAAAHLDLAMFTAGLIE
ncbi:hypothetical protein [Paenibacillus agilis]|uniref:Uncharacterized protein n=1 Tax=Paenibacillus agilis TaxID=3020863 RepID=A0A559IZX3_9BACL|nr:hypothetical protein [Paenibacillus agilis]TVX93170.1 hypothetical protein FPZ44_08925 [Paenibacillus agilis]